MSRTGPRPQASPSGTAVSTSRSQVATASRGDVATLVDGYRTIVCRPFTHGREMKSLPGILRLNLARAAVCLVFSLGTAKAADPAAAETDQKEAGREQTGANPAEALEYGETIEIVGTTPVPGLGTALEDVPATVQTYGAKEVGRQRPLSAADFLERNAGSVSLNSGQGNPFQPDVSYRGFTASPLLGTPQGMSVFLDGVRVNEPFGDVVNWDLLPPSAISSIQL